MDFDVGVVRAFGGGISQAFGGRISEPARDGELPCGDGDTIRHEELLEVDRDLKAPPVIT